MRAAVAVATVAVALLLLPASGHAEAPTPAADLPFGPLPHYCERTERPAVCGDDEIFELDQARAAMGLPPYALPAAFLAMTPDRQMLILTDLDRAAYGLPLVEGLNDGLGANATAAAQADVDPLPSASDLGRRLYSFASNWAARFPTAMDAYFFWMYADGYGSGNVDCGAPTDAGCWVHRRDILWAPAPPPGLVEGLVYSMGAAAATDASGSPAYALSVVVSGAAEPPAYSYTWSQAMAEGAGTNAYPVAPPTEARVRLTIGFRGRGKVYGAVGVCRGRCERRVREYEPIRLRADPAKGFRFVAWDGCEKPRHATCKTELAGDGTIRAIFAPLRRSRRG
jgi:hypothetical protein